MTEKLEFQLVALEVLATMKLTPYRDKDRVHLREMLENGQLEATWLDRVPASPRDGLPALLDDPER